MSDPTRQDIEDRIWEDWLGNPGVPMQFFHGLTSGRYQEIEYLTPRILAARTGLAVAQIIDVAKYFCGPRVGPLLEVRYEFLLDDDTPIEISPIEISEAFETGELLHPKTGEVVSDWKEHVVLYFSGSVLLTKLLREAAQ